MQEFQNNPILNSDLPDFESVELMPISRKYLKVVMFNVGVIAFILLVAFGVAFFIFKEEFGNRVGYIFVLYGILVSLIFLNRYFGFFQRKYAIREHDVIYHYGLLKRNFLIIPFNRIQHVALEEGWFSRILGLKSISLFTASEQDMTINGLPKDIAEKLNQMILNKIKEEELSSEIEVSSLISDEDAKDVEVRTSQQNIEDGK